MTPTGTMIKTDDERPLWARSTLRRGLPGDNQPHTKAEAKAHCPHSMRRYRLVPDPYSVAPILRTWVEPAGEHVCLKGWIL